MGQILAKFKGEDWKERQIRAISNRVFDRVNHDSDRATLTFEELYIAVLLVYNDINKCLPGPHFDPPTKERVKDLILESDMNLDGELDREEFVNFILHITRDTFVTVSRGLIIALVAAPTLAFLTKRTTENVPGVGKVVQKIPTSIYASLVTLVVVALQQNAEQVSQKPMGQILEKGEDWKERQIRAITDRVFDRVNQDSDRASLTFEELYIAVLLVYNDINKRLSGQHFDPPTKEQLKTLMLESDMNLDGELDRAEFMNFILHVTRDTFVTVSRGLIITMVAAPTVALLTKRTTENVPGVGKVVQKIPNSVYASLVTLVLVALQHNAEKV